MAREFVREQDNNSRLSESERINFYKHVKPMVAIVTFTRGGQSMNGVGWCLVERGLLMTSSIMFQELNKLNSIGGEMKTTVSVCFEDCDIEPAEIHYMEKTKSAVIVRISNYKVDRQWFYSPISFDKNNVSIGMQAFSIHHLLPYTFVASEISNTNLKFSDIEPGMDKEEDRVAFQQVKSNLEIFQLNNYHGGNWGGNGGAPIFNTRGQVIGMYLGSFNGSCYAVYIGELPWIGGMYQRASNEKSGSSEKVSNRGSKRKER